jgi:hypothetical protein
MLVDDPSLRIATSGTFLNIANKTAAPGRAFEIFYISVIAFSQ